MNSLQEKTEQAKAIFEGNPIYAGLDFEQAVTGRMDRDGLNREQAVEQLLAFLESTPYR